MVLFGNIVKLVQIIKRDVNTQHKKPIKFLKRFVETFAEEGDLVLDPFMGSGTTAVACAELNRDFIGFEINKEYIEMAEKG